jgi:hypothetical protein
MSLQTCVINRDVTVDKKMAFFSVNCKSMDNSVSKIGIDSKKSYDIEIKHDSMLEAP